MLQVVIVPDEVDAISAEVRAASEAFEIVITAGGVGPTRDDVTMAGVAEALGKPLLRWPTTLASLEQNYPLLAVLPLRSQSVSCPSGLRGPFSA